jgi:hypothetical protein
MTAETLNDKLARAEADLAAAETKLREVSLQAALSEDDGNDLAAGARDELRRARDRLDLIRTALAEAERIEQQRKVEAKAQLRASQNRSVRQQISLLSKHAQDYQDSIAAGVRAWEAMLATATTIAKLLPPDADFSFVKALSYGALRDAALDELNRVGASHPISGKANAPGASWSVLAGHDPQSVPPLAEALKRRLMACYYSQLVGETSPAPVETPKAVEIDPAPIAEPLAVEQEPGAEEPIAEPRPGMPARITLHVEQVSANPDAGQVDLTPIADRCNVTPPPGAAASLFGEAANG